MVVSCLNCGARYRIDDKRLERKTVRFVCHKCGQAHLLRDPALGGETIVRVDSASTTLPRPSAPAPTQTPAPIQPPRPSQPAIRLTTRTAALPAIPGRQTQQAATVSEPAPASRPEMWFAIKRGQRMGPFTTPEILDRLKDGTLHDRSFVWRPTMTSWTRINQVAELADVLAEFQAWTASRDDRTVVDVLPKPTTSMPTLPSQQDLPPPLPADMSRPSGEVRPPMQSSAPQAAARPPAPRKPAAQPPRPVDALYRDISLPSIDIRRGDEVQPEEPPIAPGRMADRGVVSSTPAAPVVPGAETLPEDALVEASEERKFFSKAFSIPQREWPSGPSAPPPPPASSLQPGVVSMGAHPSVGVGQHSIGGASIQDVSVLFRMVRRTRDRSLIAIAALSGVVLVGMGIALYYTLTSESSVSKSTKAEEEEAPPIVEEQPKQKPPVEEVAPPTTESQKSIDVAPKPKVHKPATVASNGNSEEPVVAPPPKLAAVDPSIKSEFEKYKALAAASDGKEEVALGDVKPRTVVEMPKNRVTRSSMDAFLNSKMRKFADCKARMTHSTEVPVKVGLSFNIDAEGRVGGIIIEQVGGVRDEALDSCIRRLVAGWKFDPPEEATTFKTTLVL